MTNGPARCESCTAEVRPEQLQLSLEGQWLCRTCHGHYSALLATRQARRADIFRRCRCGNVLVPMGDPEIEPRHGSSLNLEFVFQPSVYRCLCGVHFRMDHPAIRGLFALTGALFAGVGIAVGVSDNRVDEGVGGVVLGIGFLGYVAHKLILDARYPRVE